MKELKKEKHLCNNLNRSTKTNYSENVTKQGFANNKAFWNTVKPFLTNRVYL